MGLSSDLSFETLRENSHDSPPEKTVLPRLVAIPKEQIHFYCLNV